MRFFLPNLKIVSKPTQNGRGSNGQSAPQKYKKINYQGLPRFEIPYMLIGVARVA